MKLFEFITFHADWCRQSSPLTAVSYIAKGTETGLRHCFTSISSILMTYLFDDSVVQRNSTLICFKIKKDCIKTRKWRQSL